MDKKRYTSRELIARHLNIPIENMERYRFEPSRTRLAVYHVNEAYWCAPPTTDRPSSGWGWKKITLPIVQRDIYRADFIPADFRCSTQ